MMLKIKTVSFVTERLGQAKRFVWVFRLSAGHFMLLAILRLPFAEKQFLHFAEMLLLRFCQRLKNLVSAVDYRVSRNMITISRGNVTNRYYLFGGRDESSASLIQGMTLGGVMLDEVALMPRSIC